ncbi:MAG: hypothetical protein K9G57_00845 [Ignavibacteriales bacterium]|nr:hypothetical protein [Melioribacteraceae bacterium]MCF8435365.1 hypothetical protein [Ignavibacteriales bacterium]
MIKQDLSFLKGSVEIGNENINSICSYYKILSEKLESDIIPEDLKYQLNILENQDKIVDETVSKTAKFLEIECDGLIHVPFCKIPDEAEIEIYPGDVILISNEDSVEIAKVKDLGEVVCLKVAKIIRDCEHFPVFIRKLNMDDEHRFSQNKVIEKKAVPFFKELVENLQLSMKLVSIHYQFDRKKMFFFYTSDGRVDFRELAKLLAAEFRTRIELRQIGMRDEAKKIGGLGSCGREYCCVAFINNFKNLGISVQNETGNTNNISKSCGPCGKLKCCFHFEN